MYSSQFVNPNSSEELSEPGGINTETGGINTETDEMNTETGGINTEPGGIRLDSKPYFITSVTITQMKTLIDVIIASQLTVYKWYLSGIHF